MESRFLEFEALTSFETIYYNYIKNTKYADQALSFVFKLNKTEHELMLQYNPFVITNCDKIPPTMPVYALRKLQYFKFDLVKDLDAIIGHIQDKNRHQNLYRQRGLLSNEEKSKRVYFHETHRGCGDKGCPLCDPLIIKQKKKVENKRDFKERLEDARYQGFNC